MSGKLGPLALAAALALVVAPVFAQPLNDESGRNLDFSRIDAYVKVMPKLGSAAQVAARLSQGAKTNGERDAPRRRTTPGTPS